MKRKWFRKQGRSLLKFKKAFDRAANTSWKTLSKFESAETKETTSGSKIRKPKRGSYVNPLFWAKQFFFFSVRYFQSRSITAFLHGLPVLMVAAIMVSGYFWTRADRAGRIDKLKTQLNVATDEDDFQRADFYARKLCFLQANSPKAVFERAMLHETFGKRDKAMRISFQLADTGKYLPALEWLCEVGLEELQNSEGQFEQETHDALVDNILELVNRQKTNPRAYLMLGTAYLLINDFQRAKLPIERAVELSRTVPPELHWSLSAISNGMGETTRAKSYADKAATGFMARYASSPSTTTRSSVVRMIRALVRAHREKDAVDILRLRVGSKSPSSGGRDESLLAEVYGLWARRERSTEGNSAEAIARSVIHLKNGLALAPSHPLLLNELTELACSERGQALLPAEKLSNFLDSGISPGLIHFILGTRIADSRGAGDKEAARHLKLAMTHNAAFPGLLNNLAHSIIESKSDPPERALTLIELAIQAMPNQPYFFDTRARVHSAMKQYDLAIVDFERALAAPELRSSIHANLANIYDQLGEKDRASRHRHLSENLDL